MSKVIVIVGAGEGISKAVAEKFAQHGFSVALIARKKAKLEKLAGELKAKGVNAHYFVADASDAESMKDAFDQIWDKFYDIDVLHFNVSKAKEVSIENETADSLTKDFKINVASVMTALQLVLPDMEKKREGTILLTGGGSALNPTPLYGSLAIGKAGIRSLAQSLHAALKPKNIYVGTVTVNGYVGQGKHMPVNIAEEFWKLYTERKDYEVIF